LGSIVDAPLAALSEAAPRVVKPLQFDDNTPQTNGMHRLAAVSGLLAGSQKLWAGVVLAEPNMASSVHHHGAQETVVYVAEGRGTLRWGHRLEHESELEAGDFLLLPPYLPHQEINPSPDHPAMWIVVRSGPEAVVVDLVPGADGEYRAPGSGAIQPLGSASKAKRALRWSSVSPSGTEESRGEHTPTDRTKTISLTLLAVSFVAFVAAVFSGVWLWEGGHDELALLLTAILALLGVLDMVWAFHARTVRRLALLDAYAEREIARAHEQARSASEGKGMTRAAVPSPR
jgi:uncharacterized RmlC-like cupin family protein